MLCPRQQHVDAVGGAQETTHAILIQDIGAVATRDGKGKIDRRYIEGGP